MLLVYNYVSRLILNSKPFHQPMLESIQRAVGLERGRRTAVIGQLEAEISHFMSNTATQVP